MDPAVNQIVNDCLFAYSELVGLDPGAPDARSRNMSQYEDKKLIEKLNKSREYDETGLTTFMLLRGLMDWFVENTAFTAKEIFLKPKKFEAEAARIRKVFDMLEHPLVTKIVNEFQTQLIEMADFYQVKNKLAYKKALADKQLLGNLRYDAYQSMERLQAFQFTQGKPDPNPLKVNASVYEFWNMNSLLAGLRDQNIAGVSLCLIRDPDQIAASYFLFAVKNGESITIVTDRQEGPHPHFWSMSRGGGARELLRRIEQNHFPYELLDIEFSDNMKHVWAVAREQLVPFNAAAAPISKLGAGEPDQVIWTGLMLELVNERYGRQNLLLPETSYTAEMVVNPHALLDQDHALVTAGHYQPLNVAPLRREDVTRETTAPQWESEASGYNEWMIERYGAQVPEEVLNPVGQQALKLLEGQHGSVALNKKEQEHIDSFFNHEHTPEEHYTALSPVTFGTKEKLETDRLWVARYNQTAHIQRLAIAEYEKEAESVRAWGQKRLEANRRFIFEQCAWGSLLLPHGRFRKMGGDWRGFDTEMTPTLEGREALHQSLDTNNYFWSHKRWGLGKWNEIWRGYECAINPGVRANVFSTISPNCPEALAILFGCKVSEMPFALQHWYAEEPYTGNSILDRLDPADWVLENPWKDFGCSFVVSLSRQSLNELRKKMDLPKRDWDSLKRKKHE